jgi:hypothetical protein
MMTAQAPTLDQFFSTLKSKADATGDFGPTRVENGRLICEAKESAAPAEYRVEADGGVIWVSLVTADRWLNGSIETDLLHTGDKLDELIDEELVELDYDGPSLGFQHYRSDEKLFTFRSSTQVTTTAAAAAEKAATELVFTCLRGYEACFRNLGDMAGGDDE